MLGDEGLKNVSGSPQLCSSFFVALQTFPTAMTVPHWAEEVGNSNNVGKLLYPLVDLRSKAVIQILLTSKILYSDGILIPL